ncbi:hypothetical protein Sme01_24520 [Sphaerisporangium melleum]|uniref:Methyltransferase domain-containing protein n=1 Tax=Sphaerisporangium melleum TaxID=321316 RepID=A0A917QSC1_9ACTN|nr:class I SAM-dependent methyltransferase [Sphaerisporangium melleum]GGK65292.1 hypothetical protein GCM10007964_05410 [Sphaerisporangium melleum]GII69976.1 hypothetical protein Sme01_24520 [Sphaerisporangium melleum]
MGIGKALRHDHDAGGGTIDHPRAYEVMSFIGFLGGRRAVFTRIAALAGPRPGERVLDVGCGTGYLSRVIAPVVTPSGHVTGVDAAPAMVEYSRRRAPGNCDYVVGEGQDLPFPDGSFDLVVSTFAVHHIPPAARAETLREMFRVLRPGGRLLIAEFRPPTGRVSGRLMSLVAAPAMRNTPGELLGTLIPDAGFTIDAQGDLSSLLYYVRAVRPA